MRKFAATCSHMCSEKIATTSEQHHGPDFFQSLDRYPAYLEKGHFIFSKLQGSHQYEALFKRLIPCRGWGCDNKRSQAICIQHQGQAKDS